MGTHVPSPLESTYHVGHTPDVSLAKFLERPVRIFTKTIDTSTTYNESIYPWSDFLRDTQVRRRIEGFRFLRGTLKIRAVITGNPMIYGNVMLSYLPRPYTSVFPDCSATSSGWNAQQSHRPHIFLNPTTGEGGEMTLPFFHDENWLDLTVLYEKGNMGVLSLDSFERMHYHANAAVGQISVSLFAWMEDAELAVPTVAVYDEIEKQGNEFAEAPVSTTATAVERAAGLLSNIPGISAYAKATEMAAGTVAKVAKAFGYSRPAVLSNPSVYREFRVGKMASVNEHELVARLGPDCKGELTVDPRTVGLPNVDEMNIQYVASREGWINRASWLESDGPGTSLFVSDVHPFLTTGDSTVTPWRTVLNPSAIPCLFFDRWKGTMVFRFQVVASAFHRGRLRVVYEPTGVSPGTDFNAVYSRIIDISTTRNFEIPVNWHAGTAYLSCSNECNRISTSNTRHTTGTPSAGDVEEINGRIFLEVLTDLSSPDPSLGNEIFVNVFARLEDGEFAVMNDTDYSNNSISFRSSDALVQPQAADEQESVSDNLPVGGQQIEPIGPTSMDLTDATNLVYMGETIPSFRTMLRTYSDIGTLNAGYSFIRQLPAVTPAIELLAVAYLGWRGSLRYKFIPTNDDVYNWATRTGRTFGSGFMNNGPLEVEYPYYSERRFADTRNAPYFTSRPPLRESGPNYQQLRLAGSTSFTAYMSTGEDFSLFFFIGMPPLYAN